MTVWLVLDMDEGVMGAYPTRRAAVEDHRWGPIVKRYTYGPGSYDYIWRDGDDGGSFFVEREDRTAAGRDGWEWAYDEWIAKGRPMGHRHRWDT